MLLVYVNLTVLIDGVKRKILDVATTCVICLYVFRIDSPQRKNLPIIRDSIENIDKVLINLIIIILKKTP